MSRIVLFIDDLGTSQNKCLMYLSKSFEIPLGETKKRIEEGRPVLDRMIFDRHSPDFPKTLSNALGELTASNCRWRAFELLNSQIWDPKKRYYEITRDRLDSMIAARADSLEHQNEVGFLEDGL